MNQKNRYEDLSWDSENFGYKIAKININSIKNLKNLEDTLNLLAHRKYKLAYLFVGENNSINKSITSFKDIVLADKKVVYIKELTSKFKLENKDIQIIPFNTKIHETKSIVDLSIIAGEFSRFRVDKNFKNGEFELLYTQWALNSIEKKIASEVFVALEKDRIIGMVTCGEKNNRGDIGLIGVHHKFQGKNIGKYLLQAASNYFTDKKYSFCQVVTQKDNKKACKFYEKNGFNVENITNIYHCWIK